MKFIPLSLKISLINTMALIKAETGLLPWTNSHLVKTLLTVLYLGYQVSLHSDMPWHAYTQNNNNILQNYDKVRFFMLLILTEFPSGLRPFGCRRSLLSYSGSILSCFWRWLINIYPLSQSLLPFYSSVCTRYHENTCKCTLLTYLQGEV